MLATDRLKLTEEQAGYLESITAGKSMSRVAVIRYLIKLKSGIGTLDEEAWMTKDELRHMLSSMVDIISHMTDEEYARIIKSFEEINN